MIIGFDKINNQKCKDFINSMILKTKTKKLMWVRNILSDITLDIPHNLLVDGESYSANYGDATIYLHQLYYNDSFELTWLNLLVRLKPGSNLLGIGFGFDDELSVLQMAIKDQFFDDEYNPTNLYSFMDHFVDDK